MIICQYLENAWSEYSSINKTIKNKSLKRLMFDAHSNKQLIGKYKIKIEAFSITQ